MINKKKIFSESINIYKITFYALNSILIRISGYFLFLGLLFNTLLLNTNLFFNFNYIYFLFFIFYFLFFLLILHFYIGFCKNICDDFEFLSLEYKDYQMFIKTHILFFNFIFFFIIFFIISLNYISNFNYDLIYFYLV